jgi:hypothetical protein
MERHLHPISRLHKLRAQLHVPVDKFSKQLGIKTEIMRSLLCENHYNEAVVRNLLEKAEAELKRKRKDKHMRRLLDTRMTDLIAGWSKALGLRAYSMQRVLRVVAALTGKKYSTLYRWFRDDRKPLDIDQLYEIDRIVRESKNAASKNK